jgi:hypothetical protein
MAQRQARRCAFSAGVLIKRAAIKRDIILHGDAGDRPPSMPTAANIRPGNPAPGDGASAIVGQKKLAASKKQNKSTRIYVQ